MVCARTLQGAVAVGVLLVLAGCGDNLAPAQTDAGQQDSAPVVGSTLRVRVIHGNSIPNALPCPGATVALDRPGGGREEVTADADGRATLSELDFDLGPAVVTAHWAPYPPASHVVDAPREDELLLYVYSISAGETVTVSGAAQNMISTGHVLWVQSLQSRGFSVQPGPSWSLEVERGVPLTFIATEQSGGNATHQGVALTIHAWALRQHDAVTEATTIDLDLTSNLTPQTVQGSFPLPARAESRLRSHGVPDVQVSSGIPTTGWPTEIALNADETGYDYTLEWVEIPGAPEPGTSFFLSTGDEFAFIHCTGAPTAGAQPIVHLDPPDVDYVAPIPLHSPITWTAYETGLVARLTVEREGKVVWTMTAEGDPTSIRVPEPPSTVDVGELLGTAELSAFVTLLSAPPPGCGGRGANSATFALVP